jgi:hypothetical protein
MESLIGRKRIDFELKDFEIQIPFERSTNTTFDKEYDKRTMTSKPFFFRFIDNKARIIPIFEVTSERET